MVVVFFFGGGAGARQERIFIFFFLKTSTSIGMGLYINNQVSFFFNGRRVKPKNVDLTEL